MSQSLSVCIRCILRRHPLCKQRRSLALNIKSKLMLDDIKCGGLHLSTFSNIDQVIPTTILADILKICLSNLGILVAKPTKSGSEETSLTLAAANITKIKQALHSQQTIFLKCVLKKKDNILIRTSSICTANREHIKNLRFGRLASYATILSTSNVAILGHLIKKSIHSIFLLLSLSNFCLRLSFITLYIYYIKIFI